MGKLIFTICAFLFLSNCQHGQAIEGFKLKLESIVDTAFAKIQNVVDKFEATVNVILDKVRDKGKMLQKRLEDKINESLTLLNEKIDSAIVNDNPDCQNYVNTFRSNVMRIYHNTSECVDNHIKKGLRRIETINNVAHNVLEKLEILREEGHNCTKNVHGVLNYLSTGICLTHVVVKANVAVGLKVPVVSREAFKLLVKVNILPINVALCAGAETLYTVTEEFTTTMRQVEKCIETSVDEYKKKNDYHTP